MNLLKPAVPQTAFLKAALLGFMGSGKSFTACVIARGLADHLKDPRPVAFMDTETHTDFEIPRFKEAGVPLVVSKSRAFVDMVSIIKEAEKECSVLVIDSITHIWRELVASYMKANNLDKYMPFHHWGPVKSIWQEFTDLFVNSKLHIIVCGRAGWEYDQTVDEDGKTDLQKTGTKMKAETEFGYEPSLLLEMEALKRSSDVGSKLLIRCHVLQDRADAINGEFFDMPTFENFLPHILALNLGGEHKGIDMDATSEDSLAGTGENRFQRKRNRDIALEELKNEMSRMFPDSRSKDGRVNMLNKLKETFKTDSWTAIEGLEPFIIREGLEKLRKEGVKKEPAEKPCEEVKPEKKKTATSTKGKDKK